MNQPASATAHDGFTLNDLIDRLVGWTVVSVAALGDHTEVRLATPVVGAPDWVAARGVLFIETRAVTEPGPAVGDSLIRRRNCIEIGDWSVERPGVVAGQLLETAIMVVAPPLGDPVSSPSESAERILARGTLLWPGHRDLPDPWRGAELLAGVTRFTLSQPSLVVSVATEADQEDKRLWDTFVAPTGAIEVERHPDADVPAAVSWFPLSDVPSRLLERCGLGSPTDPPDDSGRRFEVRSTFLADGGLTVGAFSWREDPGTGRVAAEEPLSGTAVTAEVLGMLPGGQSASARGGKEVVGIQ